MSSRAHAWLGLDKTYLRKEVFFRTSERTAGVVVEVVARVYRGVHESSEHIGDVEAVDRVANGMRNFTARPALLDQRRCNN